MANKRLTIREKRRQQIQRQRTITIVIVAVVALGIVGILVVPSIIQSTAPVGEITPPPAVEFPNPDMNSMGDPNAPVTVVEFSDFQCPFCERFYSDTEPQFIDEYVRTGQVYFTYRSMGNFIGPESAKAMEAAYCAGDQGRFWDFHGILFTNQGGENQGVFADKRLVAMAETLGLDMTEFNSCFDSGKYRSAVNQDRADGNAAGVQGTPAFVINGKLVPGALTFPQLQQEIEQALAGSGG